MSSRLTSAAALAVTACLALVAAQPREVQAAAPPGTSCSAFPADNVWNTDISTLPVNSHSAAWLASTGATGGTPDGKRPADDQQGHMRAVRSGGHRLQRRAHGMVGRDLQPGLERAAAGYLDVSRRGGSSDLPGPRASRRGPGRLDQPRDQVHRAAVGQESPVARASRRRRREQPELAADGRPLPVEIEL